VPPIESIEQSLSMAQEGISLAIIDEKMIELKSKEGEIFVIDLVVAKKSNMIKEMLDVLGEENIDDSPFSLEINSLVLAKVIEWLEQHKDDHLFEDLTQDEQRRMNGINKWHQKDDQQEEKEKKRRNEMNEWDSHFFKVRSDDLMDMKVFNQMHVFCHSNYHCIHTFMSINVLSVLFLLD
jgi:hypothetical protein